MKSKEQTPTSFIRPSSPQEFVDRALAYIEPDETVLEYEDDGTPYRCSCFEPVQLDTMTDERWARTLEKVAWVLYRKYRHPVCNEDLLKILPSISVHIGMIGHFCRPPSL